MAQPESLDRASTETRRPKSGITLDERLLDPAFPETAEREETVAIFRVFFRQKLLQRLVKKTGIVEKERIFIFGDIEREFQKIQNLLCFIPLNVDKDLLKALIEKHISLLIAKLDELSHISPERKDGLERNLRRLAYRNVTCNLKKLYELEGTLVPLPLDPETQDFSRFLEEPDLLNADPALSDPTVEDEEDIDSRLFTSVNPRRIVRSFRALIERAVELDQNGNLDTVEKTGLLVEAISQDGHSNYKRMNGQALEALDFSFRYLADLATGLDTACNLVSNYVPDLPKTEVRGTIDADVEVQTLYPAEILRILSFGGWPNLKTLDEMQLHEGVAYHYLSVVNSPYYRGAKLLNRRLGRRIFSDSSIFTSQRSRKNLPLDSRGNVCVPEKAVTNTTLELRRAKISTPRGIEDLNVYFPNRALRPKEEDSMVSKRIREPQLQVENVFDMWGGMIMVDHSTEELLKNPECLEKVKIFARRLLENQGLRYVDAKKEALAPGEFTIVVRLEKKDQRTKSNGFPAIKVYLRTKGSPETPRGIPGELQLLPSDTYENKISPDHPSHPRFYEAKKLPVQVKNIFSGSVFPELHTQADYVEEGIPHFVRGYSKGAKIENIDECSH